MTNHKLFIDSGAFSAFTSGVEINIYEYIDFIKKNEKFIDVYANLDDIDSPEKTWENQRIMEKAGLSPLPTFHYGENVKWLKRYLKRYDYIALGGMVPVSKKDLIIWLDELFTKHICDKNGYPKVKVHGFGLTLISLMFRYPWFSVDSTTWLNGARFGMIFIPYRKNNQYVYNIPPLKINTTLKSKYKGMRNKHLTTLPKITQELIFSYLHDHGFVYGKSEFRKEYAEYYQLEDDEIWAERSRKGQKMRMVEKRIEVGVCNSYEMRDRVNLIYFEELTKQFPKYPRKFNPKFQPKGFKI